MLPDSRRAVLYARVSGDDRNNESRNLKGQLDMGRAYAAARGYTVIAELAEDDRGAPGAAFELPQLTRVRELAEAGAFDVLVVRELDRLSRNLAKQLYVEDELRLAGVSIEYVLGEYPDTPEGTFMKHVRAAVAEFERLKIVERTARGRRLKAEAGHVLVQGRPPLGYRQATVNGRQSLVIDEPEAALVRRIFDLYVQGWSARAIQVRMTEEGVPSPLDRPGVLRGGKLRPVGEWGNSTVNHILHNETYTGVWHYGKAYHSNGERLAHPRAAWVAVPVPAIISAETWAAAQARLAEARDLATRNLKHDYLLRRRLTCGLCGAKVCGRPDRGRPSSYGCPANSRHHTSHQHRCHLPRFSVRWLDGAAWTWVRGLLLDPAQLAQGFAHQQAQAAEQNAPLLAELAEIDRARADIAAQQARLVDLYLMDDLPREVLDGRRQNLAQRLAGLDARRRTLAGTLNAATVTAADFADIQAFAADIAARLPQIEQDFAWRQSVIERLDVQGVLNVVDGVRQVTLECRLLPGAHTDLAYIASSTNTYGCNPYRD